MDSRYQPMLATQLLEIKSKEGCERSLGIPLGPLTLKKSVSTLILSFGHLGQIFTRIWNFLSSRPLFRVVLESLLSFIKSILILFVYTYQHSFGLILGGNCRFHPSCSEYCIECLRLHGFIKGSQLTVLRLSRCHPFGSYGFDPVPEKEENPENLEKCRSGNSQLEFYKGSAI